MTGHGGTVRITVATEEFLAWRERTPGRAVPVGADPSGERSPDDVLPAAAATVFGVFSEARSVVAVRQWAPGAALVVHAASVGELAAAVVRADLADHRWLDWVHLVLMPTCAAVEEVMAWVADEVPDGEVRLQAMSATWPSGRATPVVRDLPSGDPQELRATLRAALGAPAASDAAAAP